MKIQELLPKLSITENYDEAQNLRSEITTIERILDIFDSGRQMQGLNISPSNKEELLSKLSQQSHSDLNILNKLFVDFYNPPERSSGNNATLNKETKHKNLKKSKNDYIEATKDKKSLNPKETGLDDLLKFLESLEDEDFNDPSILSVMIESMGLPKMTQAFNGLFLPTAAEESKTEPYSNNSLKRHKSIDDADIDKLINEIPLDLSFLDQNSLKSFLEPLPSSNDTGHTRKKTKHSLDENEYSLPCLTLSKKDKYIKAIRDKAVAPHATEYYALLKLVKGFDEEIFNDPDTLNAIILSLDETGNFAPLLQELDLALSGISDFLPLPPMY